MQGTIVGLFVAPTGGVPKHSVECLEVSKSGCSGDRQNDLKHHGGPSRAVCLLSEEIIEQLQESGHPISGGTTGENVLVRGFDWNMFDIGSVLSTSTLTLRITGAATPCKTIKASFLDGQFNLLSHKKNPHQTRWYAEVLHPGQLRIGMDITHRVSTDSL